MNDLQTKRLRDFHNTISRDAQQMRKVFWQRKQEQSVVIPIGKGKLWIR